MKKKILEVFIILMMAVCVVACGNNSKEAISASTQEETTVSNEKVYSNDDYSISYTEGLFEANEVRGMVRLSYCNKKVNFAGSNEIIITKDENTTVEDIIKAIVGEDSLDNVSDGSLGSQVIPVKTYMRTSESPADNSLTLVDSFMVMQKGDDVITIEIIRTVGQDDETDMTIEGAFTYSLESFTLNN